MTPSDGNSPPPLEGTTLFVEYSVGEHVAKTLREAGVRVVWHQDVLPDAAEDVEYLGRCATEGWVPLTADSDVSTVPLQKLLIKRTRLRVLRFTRNTWPWKEKTDVFVRALPAIEALLRSHPEGPFIARINRGGKIASVEYL